MIPRTLNNTQNPPLNGDYDRDPNIQALRGRALIYQGSTLGRCATGILAIGVIFGLYWYWVIVG